MKKTKVEQVLEKLSALDIRRFKKFLKSPYFNVDQGLINLFEYHISSLNKPKNATENKEIWALLGQKGAFNDVRYRKFQSDLTKLVSTFLTIEEIQNNKHDYNIQELRAIRKKKITPLLSSVLRKSEGLLEQKSKYSPDLLMYKVALEKERYMAEYRNIRIEDSNLPTLLNYLDQYFISEKLKFATDLKSRSKFVSRNTSVFLIDNILEAIDNKEIELHSIGNIYRLVYLTQSSDTDDDKYFIELENKLGEINTLIEPREAISIYTSLINFCVAKINTGHQEYLSKLFNIYQTLLSLNLLLENNNLNITKYGNIIVTALRQGESEWAETFARDYNQYLPERIRENQLRFQLSTIYFYRKEFNKVIEVLRDFEFDDVLDNLKTKATLIQTYYELNEYEALDSLLKSLRTYLSRHKELDSGRRSNYKNLLKVMGQMISIIPGDKTRISKLKNMLSAMKGIAVNRSWLDEKIKALEK